MQKKLIALAVAGVVAAPLAMAQSNVTVYGVVDIGYGYDGSHVGSVSSRNKMLSGDVAGSRIGFRGTEDLGNGLKAGFIYELGVSPDEGTVNTSAARTSVLNLSGGFGTVQFGRQLTPQFAVVAAADPFGTGGVGSVATSYPITFRLNNLFAYVSPNWNGFQVTGGWTWNGIGTENPGNESLAGDAQVFAIAPTYRNGPLYVGLNYHQVELKSTNPGVDGAKTNVMDLGATYDFGVVKLHGLIGRVDANSRLENLRNVEKVDRWMIGASAPVGQAGTVLLSYTDTEADRVTGLRDLSASHWAIGYYHRLSNRTRLYAKYHDVSYNRDMRNAVAAGTFRNVDALLGSDSGASFPQYRSSMSVGINHSF